MATVATERELKLALSEAEAGRLAARLGSAPRTLRQRNHYFDTAGGALRRLGYGLRLREENGALRLALKGPGTVAGALIERSEIEVPLSRATADALLAGAVGLPDLPVGVPASLAREAGAGRLELLGALENERRVYDLRLGPEPASEATLELDRTRYPDGSIEHEAEIEWGDPARPFPEAAIRELLAAAGVEWRVQPMSKLARLLERSGR
jgi:uncharacterized protein YjbK